MGKYKGKFEKNFEQKEYAAQYEKKSKRGIPVAVKAILIVFAIIFVLAAAVLIFANHYLNKINREEIKGDMSLTHLQVMEEDEIVGEADSTEIIEQVWRDFEEIKDMPMIESGENIVNYLLIGSDSRGSSMAGRSDAMMIVTLNKDTKKIHITSLMRACFVIYPEGLNYSDGMLNWAYSWGGTEKLIETVELNFKVNIDHYIVVNFEVFKDVVDAMGGVEIEITGREADYINGQVVSGWVKQGNALLNGEQALAFSRCRGAFAGDNDFRRTSRQRMVIEAMIHKVGSLSLTELTALADALLPAVSTDLTNAQIMTEMVNLPEYASYPIDQMLIPMENQDGKSYTGMMFKYGAEMYAINWKTNLPALEEFINS